MSAAMVVLPKITIQGKPVMTAIAADFVKGVEPCKIAFGGKTYSGTKVYTIKGDSFKVLANIVNVIAATDSAIKGNLSQVDPLTALPEKSYGKVKALPAPKK